MPKRKRSKELRPASNAGPAAGAAAGGAVATSAPRVDSEQERAAKLFAESINAHAAADRVARERAAAAAEHEQQHDRLIADKEAAAGRLRRLRADGRPRQQMAEAEAAYRAALAALTEFETGERPHWAPAMPAEDEPSTDAEPDPELDESAVDQPS